MRPCDRPNFLGIGAVRGGSTWLHALLDTHPEVWLPTEKRKELVYFDRLYHKGDSWYLRQFEAAPTGAVAVGEISPKYLASPEAPGRIRRSLPHLDRLMVILRDPASRAWSEYQWRIRHDRVSDDVHEFLSNRPEFDSGSRYGQTLPAYLAEFSREHLLVLISEEAFADPAAARTRVAHFLGLDAARFPIEAGVGCVNEAGLPRFPGLFSIASKARRRLRWWDLDVIPNVANRLGIRRLLIGGGVRPPTPSRDELAWLHDRYAADVEWVESHLGRRIAAWEH